MTFDGQAPPPAKSERLQDLVHVSGTIKKGPVAITLRIDLAVTLRME